MLQSVLLLCIGLCMSLPVSAQLKQVTQLKSGTYYRIKTGNHNSGQTAQQTPYLADGQVLSKHRHSTPPRAMPTHNCGW